MATVTGKEAGHLLGRPVQTADILRLLFVVLLRLAVRCLS